MGKRGPDKGNGGRPRKSLQDKILDGKAQPWQTKVIGFENAEELEGCNMPPPAKYLSDTQKSGTALVAKDVYENTWKWLHERKCSHLIYVQLLEQYAMSAARWIQCERAISEYGFLAKHPTTGGAMTSPYVSVAQNYMKQTNSLWSQIYQIVRENSQTGYEGWTPQDDVMERLLTSRKTW